MSLLRRRGPKNVERPSVIVGLKLINKLGNPLDEQEVWDALVLLFKNHAYLEMVKASVGPDAESALKGDSDGKASN